MNSPAGFVHFRAGSIGAKWYQSARRNFLTRRKSSYRRCLCVFRKYRRDSNVVWIYENKYFKVDLCASVQDQSQIFGKAIRSTGVINCSAACFHCKRVNWLIIMFDTFSDLPNKNLLRKRPLNYLSVGHASTIDNAQ